MLQLKIPYNIIFQLIKDSSFLKAFCIYGKLKTSCGKKGLFFNYKSRKQELSKKLDISENTLRKYIGILKIKGFAWESNNNLRLANSHHILKYFNIEEKKRSLQLRLSYDDISYYRIISEALKLKKSQIQHRQKQAIFKVLQNKVGIIKCDKIRRKVESNFRRKVDRIYEEKNSNISYNYVKEKKEFGFLDDNMNSKSYSKLLGKKSPTSGFNMINSLKKEGFLTATRRIVKLAENHSFTPYLNKYRETILFYSKGSVYQSIPRLVTFI